jgi:DNA-binding NarL/FixJ family response regulator
MSGAIDRGRGSFGLHAWADAYAALSAADRAESLDLDDLERLAVAAYLAGKDSDSAEAWERAHHQAVRAGDPARAARCAFWLGMGLMMRGEMARGGGWLARAQSLIDERHLDCAERGYLLVPVGLHAMGGGDAATAHATFGQVVKIGERFAEPDLTTFGRLGCGQALIALGECAEGATFLDQAMVAVTAGEVSPVVAGITYCATILACQDIFDFRRAQEWTSALSDWCGSQPGLVPYRGQCLVHRAEIRQLHGEWPEAMDEARLAGERLVGHPAAGAAAYQQGELHRLQGDFPAAEEAYRAASQWGREPQPGLALLRLGQGQLEAATGAIRRVIADAQDRVSRSKLLAAFVEIMLAAGDVASARAGADELAGIAAAVDAPYLSAVSAQATGAVLLAEGDARAACEVLRRAAPAWLEMDAPYQTARVRVLIGLGCRALGDEDTAAMELDGARATFRRLGAAPDLARAQALSRTMAPPAAAPGGLTPRELQVLRLVATGTTNRSIAAELFLSEKTVARHVANIFLKLGLSSRAAATAYAYEHGLV